MADRPEIGQRVWRACCPELPNVRLIDPEIELVACGSSNPPMETFPDWEETVLDRAYDQVDYISLHIYLREEAGLQDLMVQSIEMDQQIRAITAACDLVKARKRSSRTMMLSFDEWNVWYHARESDQDAMRDRPWTVAPPIGEETYTAADAIAVGSMLLTLMRHAGRVRMACIAQLVNVLAPLNRERATFVETDDLVSLRAGVQLRSWRVALFVSVHSDDRNRTLRCTTSYRNHRHARSGCRHGDRVRAQSLRR